MDLQIRNGTTTLFAALNTLDGSVLGECLPRHRHQELLKFLRTIDREFPGDMDLHLIVDNYRTHKHDNVNEWLEKHPRFHSALALVPGGKQITNFLSRKLGLARDPVDREALCSRLPTPCAKLTECRAVECFDVLQT